MELHRQGLIAKALLEDAEQAYQRATNTQQAAIRSLAVARAEIARAEANISQAAAVLQRSEEELRNATIVSPIDGLVLSRDVEIGDAVSSILVLGSQETLVLTVGDVSSVYVLGKVDESEIGHLKSKVASSEEDLSVEYLAVTEPSVVHHGSLKHMDDHAQLYDDYGHCVRAVVDIDRNDLPETPSGTTIRTRIDCGQRPVGYVWLHRLAGFVYTRVFFRLG